MSWYGVADDGDVVELAAVRQVAMSLPRTEEHLIRDRVKFRVGRIVYLAFSRDEQAMGFAFPKEERAALVAADPDKFFLPTPSDMRYNWVEVRLDQLEHQEMQELVIDAWRMVVPKSVSAAHCGPHPDGHHDIQEPRHSAAPPEPDKQ